jgi:hypothetical protein
MSAWGNMLYQLVGESAPMAKVLDPALTAELRRLVAQAIDEHTFSRAEVLELLARGAAPGSDGDHEAALLLLPWLYGRRPGAWLLALDVVDLLRADQDAQHLRHVLRPELSARYPARELGRLLRRVAWRPVDGYMLRCKPPGHRRDGALYRVDREV